MQCNLPRPQRDHPAAPRSVGGDAPAHDGDVRQPFFCSLGWPKARQALEDARERIASLLGAHPDEVTFTSGATEANNLAIFGLMGKPTPPTLSLKGRGEANSPSLQGGGWGVGSVYLSHLEHPCVIEPVRQLEARGVAVEWLPVDARGITQCGSLAARADALLCLMLANHETGAIQPVREIVHSLPAGAKFHCDAAQAVGKIAVNFSELGVTTLTASAHKFRGPKGVGLLLTKPRDRTSAAHIRRASTERTPTRHRTRRARRGCCRGVRGRGAERDRKPGEVGSAPEPILVRVATIVRPGGAKRS